MKQCWIQYEKNRKNPPKKYLKKTLIEKGKKLISQITKLVFVKTDTGHMYRQNFKELQKLYKKFYIKRQANPSLFSLCLYCFTDFMFTLITPHAAPILGSWTHRHPTRTRLSPPPPTPPHILGRGEMERFTEWGEGGFVYCFNDEAALGVFLNRI